MNASLEFPIFSVRLPSAHRCITAFIHAQSGTLVPKSWFWDVRERRIRSLTDTTIAGNTVESWRRGRYVDIWVDVMKSRTFSLWSSVTPKLPPPLGTLPPCYWQGSHQKLHASLNVCAQHPPTFQAPHSCWLFKLFSEASLSWKQLTKCQVLLLDDSFIQITVEDTDVRYWNPTFFLSKTYYCSAGCDIEIRHTNTAWIDQMKACSLQ